MRWPGRMRELADWDHLRKRIVHGQPVHASSHMQRSGTVYRARDVVLLPIRLRQRRKVLQRVLIGRGVPAAIHMCRPLLWPQGGGRSLLGLVRVQERPLRARVLLPDCVLRSLSGLQPLARNLHQRSRGLGRSQGDVHRLRLLELRWRRFLRRKGRLSADARRDRVRYRHLSCGILYTDRRTDLRRKRDVSNPSDDRVLSLPLRPRDPALRKRLQRRRRLRAARALRRGDGDVHVT